MSHTVTWFGYAAKPIDDWLKGRESDCFMTRQTTVFIGSNCNVQIRSIIKVGHHDVSAASFAEEG